MTSLLEQAFAEIRALPPEQQDAMAAWILDVLADERQWDQTFARSSDVLERLAAQARAALQAGQTQPLDPDHL